MELTQDQALQKGIEAQKAGRTREADRYYTAILKANPRHSDANHNMGVLAVGIGRVNDALPFFKTALDVNPSIDQYWLSYIDALVKEKRFRDALEVIKHGKKQGISAKKFSALELELASINLIEKANLESPSDKLINNVLENFKIGRFKEAESFARSMTKEFPDHPFGWKALGTLFAQSEQHFEALTAYKHAILLDPEDPECLNNLGTTLKTLGRSKDAITVYRQTVTLNFKYPEAHYNLANTLTKLGENKEALSHYNQAIKFKHDYAEAYYNLGDALLTLNKLDEAAQSFTRAIILRPGRGESYNNLGVTLQHQRKIIVAIDIFAKLTRLWPNSVEVLQNFAATLSLLIPDSFSQKLQKHYLEILNRDGIVRPEEISHSVIALLKCHKAVAEAIESTNKINSRGIEWKHCVVLSEIPLFLKIIELCPLQDLDIENVLKTIRKILLLERASLSNNKCLINFQISLALHCFTNEFVYGETKEETLAIKMMEKQLQNSFNQQSQVSSYLIACLASYRSLYRYPWTKDISSPELDALLKRQVTEVNQESELRLNIPSLTPINNQISIAVQKQYEENPYPRWINTRLAPKPMSIEEVLLTLGFEMEIGLDQLSDHPKILVAGCGTGQHALGVASRFKNSQVVAVDLSLASLSYAMRKTKDYSFDNIDYMQADILTLEQMGKKFDLIESVGVLHHMESPLRGWRVLSNCLKPGGVMKIGLYGEISRRHIVKAREIISSMNIGTSHDELVNFREYIKATKEPSLVPLKREPDFYNTSNFRDLVFNIQEHRFTAPVLFSCFDILNLRFLGFEYPTDVVKKYNEERYPQWKGRSNQKNPIELDFPRHAFWLQKPS
tara:strand:+ start:370 stop:2910 length:2541 start_codon:yes stop_codon:yes gene_type:complete